MVLHTLYRMVPLLKRHLCLSWHSFAAESVNTKGTKSQSSGQCIYKMSYIFIWLSGGRGSKRLSSGFLPSPSQKGDLLAEVFHELSELSIPKLHLQLMWDPPTQVGVTRG